MDNEEYKLKIFKCRKVKTPTKSWNAAGWDFYIPEDLKIGDFMNSYKSYLDDSIVREKSEYIVPLKFYVNHNDDVIKVNIELQYKENGYEFCVITDKELKYDEIKNDLILKIELLPHASINIPSGIHVNLPENVFLQAANKSGIASKRRISYLAEVIDVDYKGEIHLNLINLSELNVIISAGEKIIQMLPLFQPSMREVEEYNSLEILYEGKASERGAGGFGSSGEK